MPWCHLKTGECFEKDERLVMANVQGPDRKRPTTCPSDLTINRLLLEIWLEWFRSRPSKGQFPQGC